MSNKTRIIRGSVSIILGILMIIGFIYFGNKDYKDKTSSTINMNDYYSNLSTDNSFVVVNDINDILDILKEGTGVVFLGFPECPWCQAYVPILNEVAREHNYKKIYYYNIMEDRKNKTEEYNTIVEILNNYLSTNDSGEKHIYVPNVTFVKDGAVVANDNETSMISGGSPVEYWTDTNKTLLKTKLSSYFNLIQDVCTDCN